MNWTKQDVSRLRELAFAEKTNVEIAEVIGVPVSEIYAKRSSLGLTIAKVHAAKGGMKIKKKESPEPESGSGQKEFMCVAVHLACLTYFATAGITADFSLPCEICQYSDQCVFDWRENQRWLYQQAGLCISDRDIRNAIFKKVQ